MASRNADEVPLPIHQYPAEVIRWVDGDTVDLEVDLGFHLKTRQRCRIYGVDTPERGHKNWAEATAFAAAYAPVGSPVLIYTDLPKDKYGRMLAEIITAEGNLGHALIAAGLAVPYDGGAR